jgi:hypothetical protein
MPLEGCECPALGGTLSSVGDSPRSPQQPTTPALHGPPCVDFDHRRAPAHPRPGPATSRPPRPSQRRSDPCLPLRARVQPSPALPLMRANPHQHRHRHAHTRAWQCAHASTEDGGRGSNCEGGCPQLARRAAISGPLLCWSRPGDDPATSICGTRVLWGHEDLPPRSKAPYPVSAPGRDPIRGMRSGGASCTRVPASDCVSYDPNPITPTLTPTLTLTLNLTLTQTLNAVAAAATAAVDRDRAALVLDRRSCSLGATTLTLTLTLNPKPN